MASFVGLYVRIVLHDKTILEGVIKAVDNQTLHLADVYYPEIRKHSRELTVTAKHISNLDVIDRPTIPSTNTVADIALAATPSGLHGSDRSSKPLPLDPAIISVKPQNSHNRSKSKSISSSSIPASPATCRKQPQSSNNKQHLSEWANEKVDNFRDTEFDFQANLDRFDKATVFDQIRSVDGTDNADRLVSLNRLPKQDSSNEMTPTEMNLARQALRPAPKINYAIDENVLGNSTPKSLAERDEDYQPTSNIRTEQQDDDDDDDNNISDLVGKNSSSFKHSEKDVLGSSRKDSPSIETSCLKVKGTQEVCPCASPLQMVEIEHLVKSEFGISGLQIAENAARGIAALAMHLLGGSRRINFTNHNSLPLVVLLLGTHKTGAYGLAAARQLVNHHVQVVVCLLESQNTRADNELVKNLSESFVACGGKLVNSDKLNTALQGQDSPPELIIDGLVGYQYGIADLWERDLEAAVGLINWANRHKASILSLDIPSGLDASSGLASEEVGGLSMKPKWVVALGLPKIGLLNATLATGTSSVWGLFAVDIGIPKRAVKRSGMRRLQRMSFGTDWLVPLEVAL